MIDWERHRVLSPAEVAHQAAMARLVRATRRRERWLAAGSVTLSVGSIVAAWVLIGHPWH